MAVEFFMPELAHAVPPLSYAARVGDLLFVSGLPGMKPDGTLAVGDFDDQFDRSFAMLQTVLAMAGADLRQIAKLRVLLTRASDVGAMNARYAKAFGPPPYPARTTEVVRALPHPDMLIEMECVVSMG